jgi:hypothetical protein
LDTVKHFDHRNAILRALQLVTLNKDIANLIVSPSNEKLFENMLDSLKRPISTKAPIRDNDVNVFQFLSNLCTHRLIGSHILETYQDKIFNELTDYILLDNDRANVASVSFFFNMLTVYHSETHVNTNFDLIETS